MCFPGRLLLEAAFAVRVGLTITPAVIVEATIGNVGGLARFAAIELSQPPLAVTRSGNASLSA